MFAKNGKFVLCAFALVAAMSLANVAKAEIINGVNYIQPDSVTVTPGSWDSTNNPPETMINGIGINTSTGVADGSWDSPDHNEWLSGTWNGPFPTITFNLGQPYNLSGTHVWNWWNKTNGTAPDYEHQEIYGAHSVTIATSADGNLFTNVGPAIDFEAATADTTGKDYLFSATEVQYVKFTVNSNWTTGTEHAINLTGFQEVRFMPEPATMALLALGGLGVLLGRKRK